jgi:predicted small lipoprotein YifL
MKFQTTLKTATLTLYLALLIGIAGCAQDGELVLPEQQINRTFVAQATVHDPTRPPSYWSVVEQARGLGVDLEGPCPVRNITVVYFHRLPSCLECQLMARYVFEVLNEDFSEEVRARSINLSFIDFENEANLPIINIFDVRGPSLFIYEVNRGDNQSRVRILNQIWRYVYDEEDFKEYVRSGIQEMYAQMVSNN